MKDLCVLALCMTLGEQEYLVYVGNFLNHSQCQKPEN